MMAQAQARPDNNGSNNDTIIPLRRWIEGEASVRLIAGFGEVNHKYALLLRKITIAYGVTGLLQHVRSYPTPAELSTAALEEQFSIDNFLVRTSGGTTTLTSSTPNWNDIKGIDMISPPLSVNVYEPSFLMSGFYDSGGTGNQGETLGRYLEVEFFPDRSGGNNNNMIATSHVEEDARCHLLGILVYELFSHLSIERTNATKSSEGGEEGPPNKKTKSAPSVTGFPPSAQHVVGNTTYIPMTALGFPQSICMLVQNLLDCGEYVRPVNAYDSLDVVVKDLHLLLLDPTRFLFEHEPTSENGTIDLMFRKHKLYGREKELSLISDAFCRVSTGRSEAFFIEGYSGKSKVGRFRFVWVLFPTLCTKTYTSLLYLYIGSGKTRLVNSLTTRIEVCEGYVITHKFDEMSREHSLTDLISLFNDLCSLIHQKNSCQSLLLTVNALIEEFGTDLSVLAYLLPNVKVLAPQLQNEEQEEIMDQMNLQSVCFILQRFFRVVSSKNHPVMLFLDDLQWCDSAPFKVIEAILCDPIGESCLFFVGSYRSNEVKPDHPVFPLMRSLRSFDVPVTVLSLKGLNPKDLNTLISDALCMFPRMTKPLSDIVFLKTKGNVRLKLFPLYVLPNI